MSSSVWCITRDLPEGLSIFWPNLCERRIFRLGAQRRVIRLDINLVFRRVLSQSSSPVYSSVSLSLDVLTDG